MMTSTRRLARSHRRDVEDSKHTRPNRLFGMERRIRQSYCSYCGRSAAGDDTAALLADYYLCALCADCREAGRRRRRATDTQCERTWAEYPRIPDEPAVAALIGVVPPRDTPNR